MTTSETFPNGSLTTVLASIYLGAAGQSMPAAGWAKVRRVVVDSHLHLPDMFELTLVDMEGDALDVAGLAVGVPVEVWAGAPDSSSSTRLITGEVTSIEGVYDMWSCRAVVRGYTKDHRLQRMRRSRTFVNAKDSDIAREVVAKAGLTVGEIQETRVAHEHVAQVNQTDWEFLTWRARAIGYELGMADDRFFFRKASGTTGATAPVSLTYPMLLRTFRPRITAGNLGTETEVRVWDPLAAKVVSAKNETSAGSAAISGTTPAGLGGMFDVPAPPPTPATGPALGDLGPAPIEKGFVVSGHPLAQGAAIDPAAAEVLAGVTEQVGSTFAEAEGTGIGDPRLTAGAVVDISGVPRQFRGKWVISNARHVLDNEGYHTSFTVSGRQERSLLGLASGGSARPESPVLPGLVCGIVSNVGDPLKRGRVKVTLPWLSPQFESDWASVAQAGAGKRSGAMFLPEVGDEVLIGFESGDPRRPYVVGGVVNDNSRYQLGGEPVRTTGEISDVVWRGFASPSGNRLAFHDELPPGGAGGPPKASDLVLGTKNGDLALTIDQVAGTVTLACEPKPPDSKSATGHLTIRCGDNGNIDITTGQGGTVNVNAGAGLSMKAQGSVKIESNGPVEIKGNPIKLN